MIDMQQPDHLLLISELHGALLGDRDGLEHFVGYRESLRDRLRITMAYVSMDAYEDITRSVAESILPDPAFIICGYGSEIRGAKGQLDQEWRKRILKRFDAKLVRQILSMETDLQAQPDAFQADYRVRFAADETSDPAGDDELLNKLLDAGINARIHRRANGRVLEALPYEASPGAAALHVAESMGFAPEHVIVAASTAENASLFEFGFRGILVSNAEVELKTFEPAGNTYLSPYKLAGGIHDGVQHWVNHLHRDATEAAKAA